jgi:hypothetical protein
MDALASKQAVAWKLRDTMWFPTQLTWSMTLA